MKTNVPLAAMLISILLTGCATQAPLQTVGQVDLSRYAGKWHEIARLPNAFQGQCVGDVTAEYAPQADGGVMVINSCRKKDGSYDRIEGKATVVPGSGNAKLKVSFVGPFSGDYWIIGLDEKNYSWAVVGHPSRNYLWVLSRQPKLPDATAAHIRALIQQQGYDPAKLVTGVQ